MEQILLNQFSSLRQQSFTLTLRSNSKKISTCHRQLEDYLLSNGINLIVLQHEDNMLSGDKIQLISHTKYSNGTSTSQSIYTGSYCQQICQYVLSHCKQKMLSHKQPYPELMIKFKIQPLIRFEYQLLPKNAKKNLKVQNNEAEPQPQIATKRNSAKSNRIMNSPIKNEEEDNSYSNSFHGRKCYCCSHRSNEDLEGYQQVSNLFNRASKNIGGQNKGRASEARSLNKNASPYQHVSPISTRPNNHSNSDRNQHSPSIYFRKHLETLNRKNGRSKMKNKNQNQLDTEPKNSQSSHCIKTKRNQQLGQHTIDDDKITEFKRSNNAGSKNGVFEALKKNKFSEQEQNGKQHYELPYQTLKTSFNNTKTQIEQRYSEMSAPNQHKNLLTGRSSPFTVFSHQRNQSLELSKNKKQLRPIPHLKRNSPLSKSKNENEKMKTNASKSKSNIKIIPNKQNPLLSRQLFKNENKNNQAASNRIKKIPLSQKMQIIKRQNSKNESERLFDERRGYKNEPREDVYNTDGFLSLEEKQYSKRPVTINDQEVQMNKVHHALQHQQDNFSVTRQKINKAEGCSKLPKLQESFIQKEIIEQHQNDFATTLKQIKYEEDQIQTNNHQDNQYLFNKQKVQTSKTIPFNNDFVELSIPVKPLPEPQGNQQQYFDNLFKQAQETQLINTQGQNKEMLNISRQPQYKLSSINLCAVNRQINRNSIQSEAYESIPSSYSETKPLKITLPIDERSKSRISSDHGSNNQNNRQLEKAQITLLNQQTPHLRNQFDEQPLEVFERALFDEKPSLKQQEQNNIVGHNFLRLQTIDEVNQSIYRQNEKRQIDRNNSVSMSSAFNLKQNLSNASSRMGGQYQDIRKSLKEQRENQEKMLTAQKRINQIQRLNQLDSDAANIFDQSNSSFEISKESNEEENKPSITDKGEIHNLNNLVTQQKDGVLLQPAINSNQNLSKIKKTKDNKSQLQIGNKRQNNILERGKTHNKIMTKNELTQRSKEKQLKKIIGGKKYKVEDDNRKCNIQGPKPINQDIVNNETNTSQRNKTIDKIKKYQKNNQEKVLKKQMAKKLKQYRDKEKIIQRKNEKEKIENDEKNKQQIKQNEIKRSQGQKNKENKITKNEKNEKRKVNEKQEKQIKKVNEKEDKKNSKQDNKQKKKQNIKSTKEEKEKNKEMLSEGRLMNKERPTNKVSEERMTNLERQSEERLMNQERPTNKVSEERMTNLERQSEERLMNQERPTNKVSEERMTNLERQSEERLMNQERPTNKVSEERMMNLERQSEERLMNQERQSEERLMNQERPTNKVSEERMTNLERQSEERLMNQERQSEERLMNQEMPTNKVSEERMTNQERQSEERLMNQERPTNQVSEERMTNQERQSEERLMNQERPTNQVSEERMMNLERQSEERLMNQEMPTNKVSEERMTNQERQSEERLMNQERPTNQVSEERMTNLERQSEERLMNQERPTNKVSEERMMNLERQSEERLMNQERPTNQVSEERMMNLERQSEERLMNQERPTNQVSEERMMNLERQSEERLMNQEMPTNKVSEERMTNQERQSEERLMNQERPTNKVSEERMTNQERQSEERLMNQERPTNQVSEERMMNLERQSEERLMNQEMPTNKVSEERMTNQERQSEERLMNQERPTNKVSEERMTNLERQSEERLMNQDRPTNKFTQNRLNNTLKTLHFSSLPEIPPPYNSFKHSRSRTQTIFHSLSNQTRSPPGNHNNSQPQIFINTQHQIHSSSKSIQFILPSLPVHPQHPLQISSREPNQQIFQPISIPLPQISEIPLLDNVNFANSKPFQSHQVESKFQHQSIFVQTDYILPTDIEQNKINSDSLKDFPAIKKCKIHLCQPQIIDKPQGSARSDEHRQVNEIVLKKESLKQVQFTNFTYQKNPYNYKANQICKGINLSNISEKENNDLFQKQPLGLQVNIPKLLFEQNQTSPQIKNCFFEKDIKEIQINSKVMHKINQSRKQIFSNCIYFIQKKLPGLIETLLNKEKTQACLFINNQWVLFKDKSKNMNLQNLLNSQFQGQSIYECFQMLTGMPNRPLKDKQQGDNKRLIKSIKSLIAKKEDQQYQQLVYGVNKYYYEVVSVEKIRYFLDKSNVSKSILQCKKMKIGKDEQIYNLQTEGLNQFTQMYLLKHPKYLTLSVDNTAVNTYQIQLAKVYFYISGNYKFIIYEEISKNQYKLIKQSYLWLRHKNETHSTRYLLIVEPIEQKKGEERITVRLAMEKDCPEGNGTNRVVRYQQGGKAKDYQGGYENNKNLYLPVVKQITKDKVK